MPKRAVFETSRRELSLDVPVGVHILLLVDQSSLEGQSGGCVKTPILTGTLYTAQKTSSRRSLHWDSSLKKTIMERTSATHHSNGHACRSSTLTPRQVHHHPKS